MIERQTAKKVAISSLTRGQWVKNEGMDPSFVVTASGEKVARARVMGTVVGKFVAEDQTFASLTLDDSTDTIRAKIFKGVKPLDTVAVGELVDVIGKVREYNGEVYLIPEVVCKIENPNLELLRRGELLAKGGEPPLEGAGDQLRKKILSLIEGDKEGVTYDMILKKADVPEEEVEKVINDLLGEGVCYEPSPGKIRKI